MNKLIPLLFFVTFSLQSFSQIVYSIFPDPTGKYSTTASGICLGCSFSNASYVADSDFSNYATIVLSAGVGASRGIRAKLTSLVPGGTKAGFYVNIGTVVASLPSVTLTTYKSGSFRETILSNANIVTLLGGSEGFLCASTSASLDYDEVGISFNSGVLTVGLSADVFYAFGGASTCPIAALPVKWMDISVIRSGNVPLIKWTAQQDDNMVYDLQRSYDGVSFTPIYARGSVTGKGPATFTFSDITATGGTIFYRVEAISNNSSFSFFSKTVSVRLNIDISSNGVNLYPNPLRGNSFVIHVPTSMHGSYDLKIIDVSGRIADIPLFSADGPVIKVTLRNKLGAGIYSARLSNPNSKESFYYRLVVL